MRQWSHSLEHVFLGGKCRFLEGGSVIDYDVRPPTVLRRDVPIHLA